MAERYIEIQGGRRLAGGRIAIAGSSNQVTKCIIAAMLTDDDVVIKGAPDVDERKSVEHLFTSLGGKIEHPEQDVIKLNGRTLSEAVIPEELCRKNRISILCAGPLLHRFRRISFYGALGGDKIGARPVNFHVEGLRQMGAQVEVEGECYHLSVDDRGLCGAHIILPFPSVMTTRSSVAPGR